MFGFAVVEQLLLVDISSNLETTTVKIKGGNVGKGAQ